MYNLNLKIETPEEHKNHQLRFLRACMLFIFYIYEKDTDFFNLRVQFIGEFQQLSVKNGRTQQQRQATSVATQETPDVGPAFEPSYIYKILPSFEEGRQEDAEEFMSYLLNGINDEMIEVSLEFLLLIFY